MAYNKDSIVDYLKSKKQAADFQSRQRLWAIFDPREVYTGSHEQNKRLLEFFRIGDLSPQLEISHKLIEAGGYINAKITKGSNVLIENFLNKSSMNASEGDVVNLGRADTFGLFPLHITNYFYSSSGALILTPANGKVSVQWLSVPIELKDKTIIINIPSEFSQLFRRFISEIENNKIIETVMVNGKEENIRLIQKSFQLAINEQFNNQNLPGLITGLTTEVFAGIVIGIMTGGYIAYISWMAADYSLEFILKFLNHAIDISLDDIQKDDRESLKKIFLGAASVLRVGISIFRIKEDNHICESITHLNTIANWTVNKFDNNYSSSQVGIAGSALSSTLNPLLSIICAIKNKKQAI
jgi:hypothetical protein